MRQLKALLFTFLIILLIGLLSYLIAEYLAHQQLMDKLGSGTERFKTEKQRAEQSKYKIQKQYDNKQHTQQKKQTDVNTRTYTKKKHASKKIYHKYSTSVKLNSDSRISLMKDNRLRSNAPIYGSYKGGLLGSVKCPKKRSHDLNMYNECFIQNIEDDKFYFKKELAREFRIFKNRRTINCHYNKKFGIMQNCRI